VVTLSGTITPASTTASGPLPPNAGSPIDGEAAAQAAPLTRLIVFVPGIHLSLSTTPADPYSKSTEAFQLIMAAIGCNGLTQAPPAGTNALVACPGTSGLAWSPYSYAGTSATSCPGGGILPYSGAQTGQSLATSAAALQAVVGYARSCPGAADAQVIVIRHSLGGAVAAYWGSDNQAALIVTLDSPVSGIWHPG